MKKPLAFRVRPNNIDEVIGHENLVGENGFFRNCIKNDMFVNVVLYGNPGCGKTTIANAVVNSLNASKYFLNATNCSKQDMIDTFEDARNHFPAIVIIDEIHELNKTKQNILLPLLEQGNFYIIGTTTANPMLALNPAIRSRVHLIEVKNPTIESVEYGIQRAIKHPDGLNNERNFTKEAIHYIASISNGDMRFALSIVETLSLNYLKDEEIGLEEVKRLNFLPNYLADKDENEHYNTVSALQKSIRGSDVNAALYYLGKLLLGGDVEGLTRRLLVTAYEDVGFGNPHAVNRVYNACMVAREVGMPEARIPLSFAVIDLTLSPKSKTAEMSIDNAIDLINKHPTSVREYLKLNPVNQNTEDGYPYGNFKLLPHLIYMPEGLEKEKVYQSNGTSAYEKALNENYKKLEELYKSSNMRELKAKYKKD